MKVLQIHCTYLYRGGEDKVVANEKALLENAGISVEELIFSNTGGSFGKIIQALFNFRAYFKTRKKIIEYKPDVIHVHNLHFAASPSVIFAIRNARVPFIQTLHNFRLICPSAILYYKGKIFLDSIKTAFPWSAVFSGVYRNSIIITGWIAFVNKFHQWMGTWNKAEKYIVLTKHAEAIFLSSRLGFRKDKFVIKPNFSPVQAVLTNTRKGHFVFVGRLSEEKGLNVLLDAFADLPFQLYIAGDGPMLSKVISYTQRRSNIHYAGVLPEGAVFPFLADARALIFPSVWYEGMPMVILESLSCGVPVIASRLGAMEEMVVSEYNGLLFESGNVADLRSSVHRFTQLTPIDEQRWRTNATNSYLENYTPQQNAKQLVGIYTDVIKDNVY